MAKNIDGFKVYSKNDDAYTLIGTADSIARAYDIARSTNYDEYCISAYMGTNESEKVPFTVDPFDTVQASKIDENNISATFRWSYSTPEYTNGFRTYEVDSEGNYVNPSSIIGATYDNSFSVAKGNEEVEIVVSPVTRDGFHDADSEKQTISAITLPELYGSVTDGSMSFSVAETTSECAVDVEIYDGSVPANTIIFRFGNSSTDPTTLGLSKGTWTQITDSGFNDWKWYYNNTSWYGLFNGLLTSDFDSDIKIIGFNSGTATSTSNLFMKCTGITTVCDCTTPAVTNIWMMFSGCSSLLNIPMLDATALSTVGYAFQTCSSVKTGAYDLYAAIIAVGTLAETDATRMFSECGTITGCIQSELDKIPVEWGGNYVGFDIYGLRIKSIADVYGTNRSIHIKSSSSLSVQEIYTVFSQDDELKWLYGRSGNTVYAGEPITTMTVGELQKKYWSYAYSSENPYTTQAVRTEDNSTGELIDAAFWNTGVYRVFARIPKGSRNVLTIDSYGIEYEVFPSTHQIQLVSHPLPVNIVKIEFTEPINFSSDMSILWTKTTTDPVSCTMAYNNSTSDQKLWYCGNSFSPSSGGFVSTGVDQTWSCNSATGDTLYFIFNVMKGYTDADLSFTLKCDKLKSYEYKHNTGLPNIKFGISEA